MVRTQIQLTEGQAKTLKRLAKQQQRSVADLIRQSIDPLRFLCEFVGRRHTVQLVDVGAGPVKIGWVGSVVLAVSLKTG